MDVITKLEKLTDDERRSLEGYLDELNRSWNPERMSALVNHLRSKGAGRWHWLAVTEMAKLDMARQWRTGRQLSLESYLEDYPDLGGKSGVSSRLIWTMLQLRGQAGLPVDIDAVAAEYPNQAAKIVRCVRPAPAPAPRIVPTVHRPLPHPPFPPPLIRPRILHRARPDHRLPQSPPALHQRRSISS